MRNQNLQSVQCTQFLSSFRLQQPWVDRFKIFETSRLCNEKEFGIMVSQKFLWSKSQLKPHSIALNFSPWSHKIMIKYLKPACCKIHCLFFWAKHATLKSIKSNSSPMLSHVLYEIIFFTYFAGGLEKWSISTRIYILSERSLTLRASHAHIM